ncbi:MAG: LacI family transcriptional regulator [Tenericutes bacterium HGW-Tenericutes-5]|jgi:LacI family transcriptional regulator|nr:MAG: LacI family transcriptional regulator [Tenericutes bacterium HGW-Tenericutes-5]
MKATIKDIASAAGVSVTTVSLVLNNRPNTISQITKNKIVEIAKSLDYIPNHMAKSLVTKESKMIGLVVPDIGNNFFADLAKNIENECQKSDYSLILANANNSLSETVKYVEQFISRGVDGLILAFYTDEKQNNKEQLIDKLNNYDVPIVTVDSWIKGLNMPGVSIHHSRGGYMATKHLIELGHKKIGCITGMNGNYSSDRRLKGYTLALKEAGIDYKDVFVEEGDYQYNSGYLGALSLIDKGVSAIFACNDLMAYGCYQAIKEKNLKVPEDISVVGFDDLLFSKMLSVPLSTVYQDIKKLGSKATELIIDYIKNGISKQEFYRLEPTMVIRESTRKI